VQVDGVEPTNNTAERALRPGVLWRTGSLALALRRDTLVSVEYSEELNFTTSSATYQRTNRHGILGQKPSDFQRFL